MSNPEQKVAELLANGQQPDRDELEEALLHVLRERNAYRSMTHEMAGWLSRLAAAHVKQDTADIKATLDDFMAKRVKIVQKTDGRVH